jgi:hypothetical protein
MSHLIDDLRNLLDDMARFGLSLFGVVCSGFLGSKET